MLTIHHGNRLEALADELARVTRDPLASAFAPEVVVVQSRGVARWLSLRLADSTGVCANVRFPFPTAYAWELYRSVRGDVPEQSAFDPEVLTWRILDALPGLESLPAFAPVAGYVRGDALRRYELSARLAQLYDEYLVYRPDWIAAWERGEAPHWQAALWQRLSKEAGTPHRAALQSELVRALATASAPGTLPERVSIFGAPALPPALIGLFAALARHSDVHVFVPNPCREYWGDIREPGDIARKKLAGKAEAPYLETGNSLLASLGKQGRDFIDLLIGIAGEGVEERERFVEPSGTSVLASIQSDILDLRQRAPDAAIDPDDRSVQVHSCHSAMREVEVLHDQLLALFSASPDLEPSDVVVMTPDIETYAPYVEAVFGTAERRIPFNVSDRSAEHESTLAATLLALLELPGSRYDANRVLAILDERAVQRRFGLREADIETVRRWVREAQIRWGIDAEHRARFGLPATREHTWRFGLERLLLGYALPARSERLFAGVLPYDEVEGSLGGVLGRFQSFAESAIALDATLAGVRPIPQWCERIHGILTGFFEASEERAEELEAVRAGVAVLEREARAARCASAVPLSVIVTALRAHLEVPGRAFLSGGVTFCAMVPMRSLPFEVVCMIGMNDGAFPRLKRRDGFDLMAGDFRKGDRSRRDDDRYLFLESILSARRHLYMSYTGRHIREDTVIPPSVLVSEFLDYLCVRPEPVEGQTTLVTTHPLQAFSRRYFTGDDRLFSYSQTLAHAACVAGRGTREPAPFLAAGLPPPERDARIVDLGSLVRFFRNPARHLFERRLKVRLETVEDEIEAREPFELGGLTLFDLKQRLLDLKLRGVPHDGLALARAGGDLPHGRMGEVLFADESGIVNRVATRVAALQPGERLDPVAIEWTSGPVTLTGSLGNLSADGMLDYRMTRANVNLRVRAWIRHLALNAFGPRGAGRTSRCVTQEGSITFAPVDDARARLAELLELYWTGLHRPLHFFPRTACAYAEQGELTRGVRAVWDGGYDMDGERDDPYYAIAFRGIDPLDAAFEHAARTVFAPMLAVMREEALQ